MDSNCCKLRTIVRAFDLTPVAIASVTGVSRPYVSRLLSPQDAYVGSPQFWSALEQNLDKVIAARKGQIFSIEALSLTQIETVEAVKSVA